jgi:RNA polymerase sigma factor (sigma-70 family)
MNKDYRVSIKVRNNNLLKAFESLGYVCGLKLASQIGIAYKKELLGYVNLQLSPIDDDGNLRESAEKICAFFNKMPRELWSQEQLTPIEKNTSDIEISFEDMESFMPSQEDPLVLIEKSQINNSVDLLIGNLTPRESKVIRLRFGFESQPMTLADIAKYLGVTQERIRQIEGKALRKLRNPSLQAIELRKDFYETML